MTSIFDGFDLHGLDLANRRYAPLNAPEASLFYGEGVHGYTDYPKLAT